MTDLESHVAGLSFDDPQPFLVLADALQAEQDPWGELIALQCAGKTELAEALIAKYQFAGALSCEWKYGFVKTVTIAPALDDTDLELALQAFLALPVARLCDGIVLSPLRSELATTREAFDSHNQIIRPYAKPASLFAAIPARITRISFGVWPARPVAAFTAMPRFSDITSSFQRVTELCLVGSDDGAGDAGTPLSLPQCTHLALHCAELNETTIEALRASELPLLAALTISMGGSCNCILDDVYPPFDRSDDYPETYSASDLEGLNTDGISGFFERSIGILGECTFPALRHLDLSDSMLDAEAIKQLSAIPWLNQLTTLTLARCDLDPTKLAPLAKKKSRTKLDEASANPGFFMRYVGTME